MSEPIIRNVASMLQAGIDPRTGYPLKLASKAPFLQENMLKIFRVIDQQNAVRRYKWFNLPSGIDGELIERILYYRESGMFYFNSNLNQFLFLPYVLNGTIDCYGRYTGVKPIPFRGSTEDKDGKYIYGIEDDLRKPIYGVQLEEDVSFDDIKTKCVLLHDYSKQIAEKGIPRQIINEPLLQVMAEQVPNLRTWLIGSTGVKGMRVQNADDQRNVQLASQGVQRAAQTGDMYVPIIGSIEFQELAANSGGSKGEEFMMALQSLENLRLSTYGLDSGGLFEKKAHTLESEQAMNTANVGLVYQDGLLLRQEFCNRVNSLFGLSIWCDASESVLGIDQNMDGVAYDVDMGTNIEEGGQQDVNPTI